jgi:ABC-2 type transport system permease protein
MRRDRIATIARRELRQRLRSRSFQVTTAIGALAIVALFFLPAIGDAIDNASTDAVAVVDRPAGIASALQRGLPERVPDGRPRYDVVAVRDAAAGRRAVAAGRAGAVVQVGPGLQSATIRAERVSDGLAEALQRALDATAVRERLRAQGVGDSGTIFAPVRLHRQSTSGEISSQSRVLVYALLLMLYLTLLLYGSAVATSIVTEKASRVTEMLLTSVKPAEHLAGKLLGMGVVGLVQYGAWLAVAAVVYGVDQLAGGGASLDLANVPALTFVAFLGFFLLGYALYGALYAGLTVGASRTEDAPALGAPLSVLVMVGFFISLSALDDPDNSVVAIASLVPPLTPMVMFTRVALGSPSPVEVVGAIALALWLAGRIYRVGILAYGQRLGLRKLLALAREA